VLERTRFGALVDRMPRLLRHAYTLAAVMFGWVLFRADSFPQAMAFVTHMIGVAAPGAAAQPLARFVNREVIFALVAGALFSMPAWAWLKACLAALCNRAPVRVRPAFAATGMMLECVLVIALLLISSVWLAGSTYNPFIYFRF
jgi:alginate O-acetyltransferase complex protein AlgI